VGLIFIQQVYLFSKHSNIPLLGFEQLSSVHFYHSKGAKKIFSKAEKTEYSRRLIFFAILVYPMQRRFSKIQIFDIFFQLN